MPFWISFFYAGIVLCRFSQRSHHLRVFLWGVNLITAEEILGGGTNAFLGTLKRSSVWLQRLIITERRNNLILQV
jgi:hypothetical protein